MPNFLFLDFFLKFLYAPRRVLTFRSFGQKTRLFREQHVINFSFYPSKAVPPLSATRHSHTVSLNAARDVSSGLQPGERDDDAPTVHERERERKRATAPRGASSLHRTVLLFLSLSHFFSLPYLVGRLPMERDPRSVPIPPISRRCAHTRARARSTIQRVSSPLPMCRRTTKVV